MHTTFGRAASLATTFGLAAVFLVAPGLSTAQSATIAPANGWGYGYNAQLWHYDAVARSNVIGDVTQAGFNWLTQQIEWQEVETGPGVYDFSQLDNIVGDANKAGLKVMLSFAHAPAFYRT